MTQEKPPFPVAWVSGGLAFLVAFFIVAVTLPNTDRAMIDKSVSPARLYMQPQPFLVCGILALTFIPALCIFLFAKRWFVVELIGWLILGSLLALML